MNKSKILYVVIGIAILVLLVFTFFPNMIYVFRESGDIGDSEEDKCASPPGQTEEAWLEHMSHHPNVYAECL